MFNKKMVILCVVVFFILGGTLMASGPWVEGIDEEGELTIPLGMISPSVPDGVEKLTLPFANFPHSRHMTYACATCHHKWEYNEGLDSCTTSGCHDLATNPDKPLKDGQYTNESIRYYKYAYHVMCRDCHRNINAQNREAINKNRFASNKIELKRNGPVSCKGCHEEEE